MVRRDFIGNTRDLRATFRRPDRLARGGATGRMNGFGMQNDALPGYGAGIRRAVPGGDRPGRPRGRFPGPNRRVTR